MVLLQKPNMVHHKITSAIDWSLVDEVGGTRGGYWL